MKKSLSGYLSKGWCLMCTPVKAACLVVAVLFFNSGLASAFIVDVPDMYFKDTRTGYVWYDLDVTYSDFYGTVYNDLHSNLYSTSWHLATKPELQTLEYSIKHSPYEIDDSVYYSDGIGIPTDGNEGGQQAFRDNGLIRSFYRDDSFLGGIGEVSGSIYPNHPNFLNGWWYDDVLGGDYTLGSDSIVWVYGDSGEVGFGAMYVDTSHAVPEPATMALLGTGLFGGFMRKRRWT